MQNQYRDLIKLYADREYTGKSIILNNVSHSKIRELEILGETTEVGEGTKSPDNPFTLVSCNSPTITIYGKNILNPSGNFINGYLDTFNLEAKNGTSPTIYITFWINSYFNAGDVITLSSPNKFYAVRCIDSNNKSYIVNRNLPYTLTIADDCTALQISIRLSTSGTDFTFENLSDCNIQAEYGRKATSLSKYTEQSINSTTELNSAGSISDSYDPSTGEYVQRVGKLVLDGTEDWTENNKYEGTNISIRFVSAIIQNLVKPAAGNDIVANIKCSHYVEKTTQILGSNYLEGVAVSSSGGLSIRDFFEDAAGFKSFLAAQYEAGTPVTVYYELAEPVTTIINQTTLQANIPDTTISLTEANNLGSIRAVLQTKGE